MIPAPSPFASRAEGPRVATDPGEVVLDLHRVWAGGIREPVDQQVVEREADHCRIAHGVSEEAVVRLHGHVAMALRTLDARRVVRWLEAAPSRRIGREQL